MAPRKSNKAKKRNQGKQRFVFPGEIRFFQLFLVASEEYFRYAGSSCLSWHLEYLLAGLGLVYRFEVVHPDIDVDD